VLFLPTKQATQVHQGTPVQIQIGATGPQFSSAVTKITEQVLSPAAARQNFGLGSESWGILTEPSIAIFVPLPKDLSATDYAGSLIMGQVQIGTSPVFRLLPGLSTAAGGNNE
jgi:hypothetical protein